jgi:hypothetical protein
MYFHNSLLQKEIYFFLHTYVTFIQTKETTLADKQKLEEYELCILKEQALLHDIFHVNYDYHTNC